MVAALWRLSLFGGRRRNDDRNLLLSLRPAFECFLKTLNLIPSDSKTPEATMKLRRAVPILLLAWASPVFGEDSIVQSEYVLKTPRPRDPALGGPRDKVVFSVWIPEGVKTVRGGMCNPFSKGDGVSKHWMAMCRHWKFAYVQMDFDAVKKDEFGLLKTALTDLAKKSGHPEIEHMPLCFTGMSRGGGMSMALAEMMSERTIASVPVCLEVGPATEATRKIPVMTIFGEKDGSQMEKLLAKLPLERKHDARWAIAVQWGRKHEFALANNLSFIFLDDVIGKRLPKEPGAGTALLDIPLESGWIGDPSTWSKSGKRAAIQSYQEFSGARDQVCWLPSKRVAAVWQAFVSGSNDVKIVQPPGLGDKQPFQLHSSKRPIVVKVEVNAKEAPKTVELWDADQRLSVRTGGPWEFEVTLPPGVHSLYAVVPGEEHRTSRPHTIVVDES